MGLFLVSLFTGAIGALLAIILTPWVQHFFWNLARRAEIRFAAITDLNHLWAAFLHHAILQGQGTQSQLPDDFFSKLDSASAPIRALFPPDSLSAFEKVHAMIGHSLKPNVAIHEFVVARQEALAALYRSMGITEKSLLKRFSSFIR